MAERVKIFIDKVEFEISKEELISDLIHRICGDYKIKIELLEVIITGDNEILQINKKFLKKDYYTDVIAFNYSNRSKNIDGEIYISLDRVRENAIKFGVDIERELLRVIIHGVLHLVGEDDLRAEKELKMRKKEEFYLSKCST